MRLRQKQGELKLNKVKFGIAHGRFQPLHREHLEYILKIKMECQHLIVGITNPIFAHVEFIEESDHRHLPQSNPYSYFQRTQMVKLALNESGVSNLEYTVVPFDLFSPKIWGDFIPLSDSVLFLRIFSDWEQRKFQLFEDNGLKVEVLDRPPSKGITATEVRERLQTGRRISDLVTPSVEKYLLELRK